MRQFRRQANRSRGYHARLLAAKSCPEGPRPARKGQTHDVNDLPSLDRPEPTPPKIRALVMLEGEERLVLRPLENASPADRPVIASIALEQAIMVSPVGSP